MDNFLTFTSSETFTIAVNNNTKSWNGTLYYSTDHTDDSSWAVWDGTAAISSDIHDDEYKLYIRGIGNSVITGQSNYSSRWKLTGNNIRCIGNIENLLDYEKVALGEHPSMGAYCYYYLFYNWAGLTKAPELPATTLAERCYYYMFDGCTSLTTAPELPATTLANGCYAAMFARCTSLTTAPELPATELTQSCYIDMFGGCTSLTTAPELPATTLANSCYADMFGGCTSLTTAPELPAVTLADGCYRYMFKGCTGLTTAPELPAVTLADGCYRYMFKGCTGLTTLPELPATVLADRCYQQMFYGCVGIRLSLVQTEDYSIPFRIPTSGVVTSTDTVDALLSMFDQTNGRFAGTPTINTTYYLSPQLIYPSKIENYLTFASVNSFTIAVKNATKNWNGTLLYSTDTETWTEWDGTTAISSAEHTGEHRIYMCGKRNTVITGSSTFNSSTHKYDGKYSFVLTGSNIRCDGNIENLLDYGVVADGAHPAMTDNCYGGLFNECANLVSAPKLLASILTVGCYAYMFCRCTALTTAPELPATTLASSCYKYMFFACSKLTRASALPATTLASYCYDHMYSSCSRLETLPALPATELVSGCYNNMFSDCSKIKISEKQSDVYHTPYRVPSNGEGTFSGSSSATNTMYAMFWYAGGSTSISWLNLNKDYYTANEVIYPDIPAEPTPIDPTSMLMSWLVGRQIAGMRGKQPVIPDVPVEPDEPDVPTGIYDDTEPLTWNSLAVTNNGAKFSHQGTQMVKISNLYGDAYDFNKYNKLNITTGGMTYTATLQDTQEIDGCIGGIYAVTIGTETLLLKAISVPAPGTYAGIDVPEKGIYVTDYGALMPTYSIDFESRTSGELSITWDGVVGDKESVLYSGALYFVKVSDTVPSNVFEAYTSLSLVSDGVEETVTSSDEIWDANEVTDEYIALCWMYAIVVLADTAYYNNAQLSRGVWFVMVEKENESIPSTYTTKLVCNP